MQVMQEVSISYEDDLVSAVSKKIDEWIRKPYQGQFLLELTKS